MKRFMENYDVLVMPSLPITAFTAGQLQPGNADALGKWVNWTPFSYPFNLTQQPACSVNCGFDREGLPIGLQIVGRMFDDRTVLRVAATVEEAVDLLGKHPKGFA
ncbi:MAG: amidase family protein [Hyphomicrobiales bacterium]